MKALAVFFRYSFLGVVALALAGCGNDQDRRIRLADRPITALMQDKVQTIQIAAAQKKKVAILKFQQEGGRALSAWVQDGIEQELIKALSQSQQLNLTPSRFVQDAFVALNISAGDLQNANAGRLLARRINADVLVTGRYRFLRDSLTVAVELRDGNDGQVTRSFDAGSAVPDTLNALIDVMGKLTWQLRVELEDDLFASPETETTFADVSTSSKEAYKLYIQALEKQAEFDHPGALALFQQAVLLDTTFASAYMGLAHACMSLGLDSSAAIFAQAVKYAKNLPDRERLPILAMNALIRGEFYKTVQYYTQVIDLYPEDVDAHYQLGNYYFGVARDYQKAIERYETAVELDPKHKLAINQLAYAYAAIGELDHAFHTLDQYVELAPNEPNPYDSYGEILQREGKIEQAIKFYKKALEIRPDYWHSRVYTAVAYDDLGKTRKAGKLLRELLADTTAGNERGLTYRYLALHELLAGDRAAAEQVILTAAANSPDQLFNKTALLTINPDSPAYREDFYQAIQKQVRLARETGVHSEKLLHIVPQALNFGIGVDEVGEMLQMVIDKGGGDPIVFQAALAYKMIIDFQTGHYSKKTQEMFEKTVDPKTFEFAGATSWNEYWRHYFKALAIASEHGVPVAYWADGFYKFAEASGNRHFAVAAFVAKAAAEYYTGGQFAARDMLQAIGFPMESSWKVIGPFKLNRGFHQKFWPEKIPVENWPEHKKYAATVAPSPDGLFDGYVDLKPVTSDPFNNAAYALLEINSKKFQEVQLRFGVNGRLKVWLNNSPVIVKNVRDDAILDQYITNGKLRIGANYLLVRVDDVAGELGFYFRLTDLNGETQPDVDLNPPTALAIRTDSSKAGS